MTAGYAVEMADRMRPNNEFDDQVKQNWLRECDARLRSDVVDRYAKKAFADAGGADKSWNDGLEYDTALLVPENYAASIYPHWLCAQMDLAMGETARAESELKLYQEAVQNFTDWLKRTYPTESGGKMTAGLMIGLADGLRPDYNFSKALKENWLRECDARLRRNVVERSACGDFDAVGADIYWMDGLPEDAELLVPESFRAIYIHWLCAQMDLAKGENDRGVNEMQRYSDAVQEFAVWMRRTYPPAGGAQWRY